MRHLFILPVVIFCLFSCSSNKQVVDGPGWLQQKIDKLEKDQVTNPPASIYSYQYKNELVYYFPAPCCDFMSKLYNEKGEIICHPDGGITGKGDKLCPDFFDERADERLIWQDPRNGE